MQDRKIKLRIVEQPLPQGIHGASVKDGDTIIVFINEDDTPDEQQGAFIHEMLHVWHGDHDQEGVNVQQLEAERHRETQREVARQRQNNPCRSDPGDNSNATNIE